MRSQLQQRLHQLEALTTRRVIRAPLERVHDLSLRVDELEARVGRAVRQRIRTSRDALTNLSGRLEALSPLGVLARGYSYTQLESTGEVVHSVTQVAPEDRVVTTVASGRFVSTVNRVEDTI